MPGIVLTGATASGKTELGIVLAECIGGEIISADSRQVYRGLDIGTAKPSPEQRARVPHHGLDLVEPGERYSAGRFARDARAWMRDIIDRGRTPILVGGTGFFLRALFDPLFEEPPIERERKARLEGFLRRLPSDTLMAWLEALDPEGVARMRSPGGGAGVQRVLRLLEVALLTGRPLGWWQRHRPSTDAPFDARVFVLERPRQELDARIDERVDAMLAAGLVGEVRALLDAGHTADEPGMNATGYPEIASYIRGEVKLEQATEAIRRATRRYARRQLTWFRTQLPADAHALDGTKPVHALVAEVAGVWRSGR